VDLLVRLRRVGSAAHLAPSAVRRFALTALACSLLGGALSAYLALLSGPSLSDSPPPHFQPIALFDARAWLAERVEPRHTILAEPWDANVLAGGLDGRVFLAHGVASLDPAAKKAALAAFFDPATADRDRAALLAEYCVAYVVETPRSRALGQLGSLDPALLAPVYDDRGVTIFRVGPAIADCPTSADPAPLAARPAG
jgi:hypothetical protein